MRGILALLMLAPAALHAEGAHQLRLLGDMGLSFGDTASCVDYYNAAPECHGSDFAFTPGAGAALQLRLPLDLTTAQAQDEVLGLGWIAEASGAWGADADLYALTFGALIEIGWLQLSAALGYGAYSGDVPNPKYDPEDAAKYDWYMQEETLSLSGAIFALDAGIDAPLTRLSGGELGVTGGIHYPLIIGEEITSRLSLRLGLSYAFDP